MDVVANATIAAVAKHGAVNKPTSTTYHVTPSSMNPLKYSEFFEYLYQYFNSYPLVENKSIERIKFFNNFEDFSDHIRGHSWLKDGVATYDKMDQTAKSRCKAKVAYAEQLCKMYEFAGLFNAR